MIGQWSKLIFSSRGTITASTSSGMCMVYYGLVLKVNGFGGVELYGRRWKCRR